MPDVYHDSQQMALSPSFQSPEFLVVAVTDISRSIVWNWMDFSIAEQWMYRFASH